MIRLNEDENVGSCYRGVIQSFVEKHFPTDVDQSKPTSIFDLIPSQTEEKSRPTKKRKSMHRRTAARSISCDTNESSDDSDNEFYSSFVQPTKRRAITKHRDQNNNNQLDDIHNSENENSCESSLIEDDYFQQIQQQQHTFAELLGQIEGESGLPIRRIPKKEIITNVQNCKSIPMT